MGKVSNEEDLIVHLENHLVFSKAVNGFNIHFHTLVRHPTDCDALYEPHTCLYHKPN